MKSLGRWVAVVVGIAVVAWLSYRLGQGNLFSQSRARGAASAAELLDEVDAPEGWTVHEDDAGFEVALPAGWQARAEGTSGKAVITGPEGDQVVIWPVFTPANNQGAGPAVLRQLSQKVFPRAQWQQPEMIGREAARQFGHEGESAITASFVWAESPRGVAGTFYCVRSMPDGDEETQEMFARILESFRVMGSEGESDGERGGEDPQRAVRASFQYARWMDPKESAFSLEIPSGWRMEGGMFRFAPTDTRPALVLMSPDGAVRITGGESRIPTFAVPNQTLDWTGFTEGKMYSPGYGVNMMVRRYLPGTAFATDYVQGQIGQSCGGLQIDNQRDRPDAVEAINRVSQQYGVSGISTQMTAGEVKFGCSGQGGAMRGYYYATTQLTEGYGTGTWNVQYLYGYVAPQDREGEAQQVLSHMLQTVEMNPQWLAMQQGITANTSKIVAETNRVVTEAMSKSFDSTQSTMDEISRKRSNANRGVVDVTDEATGLETQVQSGSNYYWIDQRGNIVGTDVYNRPTIDFREMVQRP